MTRNEALEKFREEEIAFKEQTKLQFCKQIEEQAEHFADTLKQVFRAMKQEVERVNKEKMMFVYFSLLRVDLLKRNYQVMVQVFDARWYMDTEPVCLYFSLDFLFEVLHPFWDQCIEDSRKYMGKINKYDIGNLYQELAMECNSLIAAQLRYMLRDLEQNKDFDAIPKEDVWNIRWGEYRDQSEIIACVDRVPKNQKDFDKAIQKTGNREDTLVASYWYKTDLTNCVCCEKQLYFIQFENCTLTDIVFDGSNLTGARFLNCTLTRCSFKGAILRQVDFENSTLTENDFEEADMTHAIFSEEILSTINLSADQEAVILAWQGVEEG